MKKNKAKIIVVHSPCGGSGKSTIAANLALILAKSRKVLIVDLALYGSMGAMFKIPQKGGYGLTSVLTMLDLILNDEISVPQLTECIKGAIVNDAMKTKVDIFISSNPVKMQMIDESYIKIILDILVNLEYELIIIDTSSELSISNLVMIESADFVAMPVTQDIICGWKAITFKEIIQNYTDECDKFGLIVNKCNKYAGFNNNEYEKEIGFQMIGEIPFFEKGFQSFINSGNIDVSKFNKTALKCFSRVTEDLMRKVMVKRL